MPLTEVLFFNIKTENLKTSEELNGKKIEHEFTVFKLPRISIESVWDAKILAKRLGRKLFPVLSDLIKNEKDKKRRAQYVKTKAWVIKKTVTHPRWVEKCAQKLLSKMKNTDIIKNLPLDYRQIKKDICMAALLHDIGRLCEVDLSGSGVEVVPYGLRKSHALLGYEMLKTLKIKPEILLAVRYHEFWGLAEAKNDERYICLSAKRKELADFYIRVLQDMDKTANLQERSAFGIKKSAEFFNPYYVHDYDITDEYLKTALEGKYLSPKGGHLLDVMVHLMTWTYETHFAQTKEMLSLISADLFKQMYGEAQREFENSADKNKERLQKTLDKIAVLEEYVTRKYSACAR